MKSLCVYLGIVLALGACNTALKVQTSAIPGEGKTDNPLSDPTAETGQDEEGPEDNEESANQPVPELVNDFGVLKEYVQSRSTVAILLSSDLVTSGESLSLYNQTTQTELLDAASMAALMATNALTPLSATVYALELPASVMSQLRTGDNELRLNILSSVAPRYALATVQRRDFVMFDMLASHFNGNVQVNGQFQGWLNTVSPAVVKSGSNTMTVGMTNIVNH